MPFALQQPFSLRLSVDGEWAGEQHWQTQPWTGAGGQSGFQTRVETEFGGILPAVRQVQISHYGPDFCSLYFSEQEGGARSRPSFETVADPALGLLTLRQGRDEAAAALVAPHYDPVSLLMLLRSSLAPQQPWRASMTGGRVHVQPLETATEGSEGAQVRSYILRPGGARVCVETQPPYRITHLWQPTDFGAVEAHLDSAQAAEERTQKPRRRVQPGAQRS